MAARAAASRAAVAATFYRGGTSRGLFFQPSALAAYPARVRDQIICAAMGSPDPDGRQIDGLGGGASSLSKCAIVSLPGDAHVESARRDGQPFPGLERGDDVSLSQGRRAAAAAGSVGHGGGRGWDVVYRFGQVAIRDESVDWGSTCGNLVAAAAHFGVSHVLPPDFVTRRLASSALRLQGKVADAGAPAPGHGDRAEVEVRLFAHDSAKVVTARLRCAYDAPTQRWWPDDEGEASIAGVPGTASPILVESPLGDEGVLSTGKARDTIRLDDGREVEVSVADTGLPTIFVDARSLLPELPLSLLASPPSRLESDASAMALLEQVRVRAAQLTPQLAERLSPPAPKVCVLHPRADYVTTGGDRVAASDMDVLLRGLSNAQVHRTVPATTLSAACSLLAYPDSIVSHLLLGSPPPSAAAPPQQPCAASLRATRELGGEGGGRAGMTLADASGVGGGAPTTSVRSLTVGQPAGLSTASVKLVSASPSEPSAARPSSAGGASEGAWRPDAILMLRTARRIMHGEVDVPPRLAALRAPTQITD